MSEEYIRKYIHPSVLIRKDKMDEEFCHHLCPYMDIDFSVVDIGRPIKVTAVCKLFFRDELFIYIDDDGYKTFVKDGNFPFWKWIYIHRHKLCKEATDVED